MTDQEMLRKCYDAFVSLKTADKANQFLKQENQPREVYMRSGQNKVRTYMMDYLEQHLGIGKCSA